MENSLNITSLKNSPNFSGFHHSNFLSMSGSWVGKNHNIPQNKFNLLPDIHDRIGQMKFGQKGAPLQYTSLRIVFKMLLAFLLAVMMMLKSAIM